MNKKQKTILLFIFSIMNCMSACAQSGADETNMNKLKDAYSAISHFYVDKTDNSKLVEDAITGILEKLDPHSSYTNAEETRKMNEPLEGNFDGIGIQFNMLSDTLYVIQVIAGGPSEKVGILAGDRIIYVDDSLIAGVKKVNTDIMGMLRGKKGTIVNIKVKRREKPDLIDFKITRDKIPLFSIDASYMADEKTGYIRLSRFAASSREEFEKAVANLKKQGMENLILDLQGNGGGYLNIAYDLSDEFLENGKLVVYTQGHAQPRQNAIASERGVYEKGKLVIMVDEYSASASEILAGAIQDWDRGVIVGRRTFGKALVQRPISLPDNSMIRLTIARYYTPSGRDIQKPYENGNIEAYNHDLINRFNKGELISADSIHFPDSLKYKTLVTQRTVYGGGGIMPDIFIPMDTSRATDYHLKLVGNGIINRITVNYIDKNRKEMKRKYADFKEFNDKFAINNAILDEMIRMATEDKIEFNEKEYSQSKNLISLQLKALIARDLFDTSEYFYIINKDNKSYLKALEIINDSKEYDAILAGS